MTGALEDDDPLEANDSFGMSWGAALTTPAGVAFRRTLRSGRGITGNLALVGAAPSRAGGIPGGGPGGILSGGRPGGPGGNRTPGGGTPGRRIIPGCYWNNFYK